MRARDGRGFVSLVGAGPGDPGLITVAGVERLRRADVLVYDRLVNKMLVDEAPERAERIYAGKAAGAHAIPQDEIGGLLVDRAQAGRYVVRLKGGDPFVFGRGGEEAEALVNAGIEFEVIPGVTSALAAPAYAGIPVTHRNLASSFAVITGHEDEAKEASSIDWAGVARGADTLLFLMSRRTIREIAERLIADGRAPDTLAAAVQWGSTPQQRVVTASLATLADALDSAGLKPPVVVVVGAVVGLRDHLRWFDNQPLFGKCVLVTRTRQQAGVLARRLVEEGAEPLELPTIEIVPADPDPIRRAIASLAGGGYDWALFTSTNGVREFFRHLELQGLDVRALGGTQIGVIGSETARALRAFGLRADVAPDKFVAESLLEALADRKMEGKRVLLARAAGARDRLPKALGARGAQVDDVPLYIAQRVATPHPDAIASLEARRVDIATFTSSSTVTGCLDLLGERKELLNGAFVACIGPITARTAEAAGLNVGLVSDVHTIPGLVAALRDHFGKVAAHA